MQQQTLEVTEQERSKLGRLRDRDPYMRYRLATEERSSPDPRPPEPRLDDS